MAATSSYYPAVAGFDSGDIEKGATMNAFADKTLRGGFVRKVFGLLAAQLALTTLIAGTIVGSTSARAVLLLNPWLLSVAMIGSLALVLVLSFSRTARHSHPTNLVLLFAFTALEGLLVGAVSATYATDIVVLAFGITAATTAGLSLYALRTKSDYTPLTAAMAGSLLALIATGLLAALLGVRALDAAMAGFGAVLFCVYIVMDVQLLVGGDHAAALSPDEYVTGALQIYLDIVNLFLHILRLLNEMKK